MRNTIDNLAKVVRETSGVSVAINITKEGYKIHFMNTYIEPLEGTDIELLTQKARRTIIKYRKKKVKVCQTHEILSYDEIQKLNT